MLTTCVAQHLKRISSVPLDEWDSLLAPWRIGRDTGVGSEHKRAEAEGGDAAAGLGFPLEPPVKVFSDIFTFFDKEWDTLTPEQRRTLQSLPLGTD